MQQGNAVRPQQAGAGATTSRMLPVSTSVGSANVEVHCHPKGVAGALCSGVRQHPGALFALLQQLLADFSDEW